MSSKALFIGLDYNHIEYRKLNNTPSLNKLIEYLKTVYNIDRRNYEILTDINATHENILSNLYKLGLQSWSENLDYVFIYYIGDTINIADYAQAYSGRFNQIKQGIVPSDYNIKGVLDKTKILNILDQYNPRTKIIFIADSCFLQNNIFNLEFNYNNRPSKNTSYHKTYRRIVTISYSLNNYSTDDDNYYNVLKENENIKSFADFIIKLGYVNDDIFCLLHDVNSVFNKKKVNMTTSLSASFNLTETDKNIFKCFEWALFANFRPIQEDNFLSYSQTYHDITDKIREQFLPSIQPIQKIHECYC